MNDIQVTFTMDQAKAVEDLLERNMAGSEHLVHAYDSVCDAITDAEEEEEDEEDEE